MKKLEVKNTTTSYKKRAICNVDIIKTVFNEAENEGFKFYSFVFAYDGILYYVSYSNENNVKKYTFSNDINDNTLYDSLELAMAKYSFVHEITILQEYQNIAENAVFSIVNNTNVVESRIGDDFILKPYIVNNKDPRFNTNMTEELNKKYQELQAAATKQDKLTFIVLGCALLIIAFFIILSAVIK